MPVEMRPGTWTKPDKFKRLAKALRAAVRRRAWLLSITVLGAALRLWNLPGTPSGLWYDEIFPWDRVYDILTHSGPYFPTFLPATNVLAQILFGQYESLLLLGPSTLAIRLPGALYGIALVPVVYWLAEELFDERTALWASFFTAVCPLAIQSSRVFYMQESMDPLLLLTLGTVLLYVEIRRARPRYSRLVASYVMFGLVASQTFTNDGRLLALVLLGALLLNGILLQKKSWSKRDVQNLVLYPAACVGFFAFLFPLLTAPGTSVATSGLSTYVGSQNLLISYGFGGWLEFMERYASYFSPNFLMFVGDPNPSQNTGVTGELLLPIGLLFYVGCITIIWNVAIARRKAFQSTLIALWVLVTPLEIASFAPANYTDSGGVIFWSGVAPTVAALGTTTLLRMLGQRRKADSPLSSSRQRVVGRIKRSTSLAALVPVAVVVATLVSTGQFGYAYFITQPTEVIDDPTSQWGIMYGFPQVAEYIYANHLSAIPVYISPHGLFGNSTAAFDYWFYSTSTPQNFLDFYSKGTIRQVNVTYPPYQYRPTNTLVISGDREDIQSFEEEGIQTRELLQVGRPDGVVAVLLFEVYANLSSESLAQLSTNRVLTTGPVNSFTTLNDSALLSIRDNFTASVWFHMPVTEFGSFSQFNLLGSLNPTFAVGLWGSGYYPQLTSSSGLIPVGDVYSNIGNWSLPDSWQRLVGPGILEPGRNYMLTLACNNGSLTYYVNGDPVAESQLAYPIWPFNGTLALDQYTNITITQATIWNIGLSPGQIGYLYYSAA